MVSDTERIILATIIITGDLFPAECNKGVYVWVACRICVRDAWN